MFKLVSDYKPAGDQPKAIKCLTDALLNDEQKLCLVGVTGSGKTYTMASVMENVNRPTLVLTHNKTLAAQLYREFREFFPDNAVEYFVSYYDYYQPEAYVPTSDLYIEKDASINDEIDRLRLRATASLLERRDVVIVSSVSCIYGLGSPDDYRHSMVMLDKGLTIERNDVIQQLLHIQYSRNDMNFTRGNFRVRGDTIELLPAYRQEAIRIEWFDDEIENISLIDPLTGKTIEKMDRVVIYPAKHFITTSPKLKVAVEKIKTELEDRIKFFHDQNKPLEAERIETRTKYDLEMLQEMGYCNGIENYSRHLTNREAGVPPDTLIDYFPDDFMLIVDESHASLPQVRGMYAGDRARKQNLVDFGFRLPSALDNRPLNFEEFEEIAKTVVYVSATPAVYELEESKIHVEQLIRPTGLLDPEVEIRPVEGQIEDLTLEIRKQIEKDERTLVTTLTKKMAEDLSDYFSEMELKVAYLHSDIDTITRVEIIRDLRAGEFDVLVGVNLLREGLDMPEVSLVAILDADKEGFLRNERSLMQTIGRAARNQNGRAILYAEKNTDSMKSAIKEIKRRREIQRKSNEKNGITPTTIVKNVHDIITREIAHQEEEEVILEGINKELNLDKMKTKKQMLDALREAMLEAAAAMEFEKAALIRDKIQNLESDKDIKGKPNRKKARQRAALKKDGRPKKGG